MQEYCTEAIVLDKEGINEADARVFLYTKDLGQVAAKATSARKIVSKLNGHLEPLNLVKIRLVHKKSFQIVDALTLDNFNHWRSSPGFASILRLLGFIKEMTSEGQNDYSLWLALKKTLESPTISYRLFLKILGFDPQFALCYNCQKEPDYFLAKNFDFFCKHCLPNPCEDSFIPLLS